MKATFRNFVLLAFVLGVLASANAQDRPNILFLVTEDMSPYLSCYGNKMVQTPNLDKLAAGGIRFTRAHSNSVQCSPSRSTLISGIYAVTLGTDKHRSVVPVRDEFYFPIYLRNAGYYTVNNPKQDYNNEKTPANVWDVSNNKGDYRSRPDRAKPFFAQYNQGITHMTRVISKIADRTGPRVIDPKDVTVPAYIPDLPEVRNDISWNMGAVKIMDDWVGEKIAELKDAGEYENTIIFFFSDHGGTVPQGKGYVYESGTAIPLIVSFPEKWKHLAEMNIPSTDARLVSFVDFAPTVLRLAGVPVPSFMHGRPFFTDAAKMPGNKREFVFTFRANQGPSFAPSRAISDGRYKLIWNFQSGYPNGTRQDYQWQMPAQQAWDLANKQGKLTKPIYKRYWLPTPQFELYDLAADSLEVNNLAGAAAYAAHFQRLRKALTDELYAQKDIGLMPPVYRASLKKDGDPYTLAVEGKIDVKAAIDAAILASARNVADLPKLVSLLGSGSPAVQYWAASGICGLAKTGKLKVVPAKAAELFASRAAIEEVNCMLAEALVYTGKPQPALNYLVDLVGKGNPVAGATLQNVGDKAMPVADAVKDLLDHATLNNKFLIRSILINCNKIPYGDLYKLTPGEKMPEQ